MLTKYKHLFLDLDNTILDFSYASKLAFHELLKEKELTNDSAYTIYKNVNQLVWTEFESEVITAEELRSKRFDLFLEAMRWEGEGVEWNRIYLLKVIEHTKFMDGAQALLHNLSKNFQLHIVTNGLKEVQRPRITMANLDGLVSSITVSDEIGSAKPQNRFFDIAFENAGSPRKENVLMVGDSYQSDIKGAHNYGIDSCWLNASKLQQPESLHTYDIQNIAELIDI